MHKIIEKSCCGNNAKDDGCCKKIKEVNKLASELSSVNASVEIPNVLLFVIAVLHCFDFSSAQDKEHSYTSYISPLIIPDISVLHQVFRI